MKTMRRLISLLALSGMAALLSGCSEDDEVTNGGGGNGGGATGNAPATLRAKEYQITEPGGNSVITFTALGSNYTLARPGVAQESGSYNATRIGNDTWDVILNNSLDGSTSRLALTFTGTGVGNFSYTPPNAPAPIIGQFQLVGFGSTTTGTTTTGTTTTGTTTTGTTTTGTTTTGTTTTGGGSAVTAPATLSQVVINSNAGNPAGGGQSVINISGNTFVYASGGFSGTTIYTPTGNTARLRLTYTTGDFDDYTLVFRAPSGSSTLSTFSGTQKAGLTTGPASGTFTYTQ